MTVAELKEYLTAGRHVHLIGIGGVSMFPLAEVLKRAGLVVTGSDIHENANVDHLIAQGIPVTLGHRPENIRGADEMIKNEFKRAVGRLLKEKKIEIREKDIVIAGK